MKIFIEQTKAVMAEKKISPAELARRLDKAPSNVSRYLSGDIAPGIEQVRTYAEALGVPMWRLFKEPDEEEIAPDKAHALWLLNRIIDDKQRLRALSLLLIADNEMFETIEDAMRPFFKMAKGKNLSVG